MGDALCQCEIESSVVETVHAIYALDLLCQIRRNSVPRISIQLKIPP
jgi:hypothetical protein